MLVNRFQNMNQGKLKFLQKLSNLFIYPPEKSSMFGFIPASNPLICIILVVLTMMLVIMSNSDKIITPYVSEDEYFDRIYKIEDSVYDKTYYLRLYCKQHNFLSVSITHSLEFQEHPRFPIHPSWKSTPNMQKKTYTFFQSCGIDFQVNKHNLNGGENFIVDIRRKSTGVSIFQIKNFEFKSQNHVVIQTIDNSVKWGLGQRFQKNFHVRDGYWTIWNRDRPWVIDEGKSGQSKQTYGHQPVYLAKQREDEGKFHLIYLKNTFGLNYESKQSSNQIAYTITGGNIHFLVLIGEQPETILKQYHSYIGNSHIPPFWAMGYHQSRWGYPNLNSVKKVIDQFDNNGLPIDIIWSDLDYMDKKAIFTLDDDKYPASQFRSLLNDKKLHWVPLIDVGVSLKDYVGVNQGKKMNVFFYEPRSSKTQYVGKVWPGEVNFVDYLHPNASTYWESQLDRLYQKIPFSGVWLDMNEPSNFAGNQRTNQQYRVQYTESINMMTINIDLNHYGPHNNFLKHEEVHAYYGHLSTLPTHKFLKQHGRPFIISRSNSVGSGSYAGHWTGDNVATWDFLRLSISGNFLFQIFGIHMVGADICGFRGNTNQELCARWMQVGSMYPFSRNHNENESISQQPFQFGKKLLQTSRISYLQRYSLLKQMYSTLVFTNGTGSFYRPIVFEFPFDKKAYIEQFLETEFMIGDYLLGAPIVTPQSNSRPVYFPGQDKQRWYQLSFDEEHIFNSQTMIKYYQGQTTITIDNKLPSAPPLFLRGGRMILANHPKTRTSALDSTFILFVGLDTNLQATGEFMGVSDFNDEKQISSCLNTGCKLKLKARMSSESRSSYLIEWSSENPKSTLNFALKIERVVVFDENNILKSEIAKEYQIDKHSGQFEVQLKGNH